jgi:predicted double-glycine peptidase
VPPAENMMLSALQKHCHWIVIFDYELDGGIFYVNDPWLGEITYNESELYEIWKDRNFFFFEIPKEEEE